MSGFDVGLAPEAEAPPHFGDSFLTYLMEDDEDIDVHIIEAADDPGNLVILDGGEGRYTLGDVTPDGFHRWGTLYEEEVEKVMEVLRDG